MKSQVKSQISDFSTRVYEICSRVPAGRVSTYACLAKALGQPGSARAVGQALKRNPFAPQVPCHRVIRADGSLGGFQSGTKEKTRQLRREGVLIQDGKIDLKEYGYDFQA